MINDAPHRVGEARRWRVLHAVRALDFRPNARCRGLRRMRNGTIGPILPNIANPPCP